MLPPQLVFGSILRNFEVKSRYYYYFRADSLDRKISSKLMTSTSDAVVIEQPRTRVKPLPELRIIYFTFIQVPLL